MLARELDGLDVEVIEKGWSQGLKKARGDFVCLLEEDSAVDSGTIRDNLAVFTENPSYRKLAMVSPMVDFDDGERAVSFSYDDKHLAVTYPPSSCVHATRIGYVPGAVIRRSSLIKSKMRLGNNPMVLSTQLSLEFWNSGLRISLNPDATYFAPVEEHLADIPRRGWNSFPKVTALWERELIS